VVFCDENPRVTNALKVLFVLANEHVLRPFDLKVVRRSGASAYEHARVEGPGAKRVVFFHVPKCGGTSIREFLAATFGRPIRLDTVASEGVARNFGVTELEVGEVLLAYFVQGCPKYIGGHYPYSRRVFAGHEGDFEFITVLRNPLDRMLSLYYFNRFRKDRDYFSVECELSEWLASREARRAGTVFVRTFMGDLNLARRIPEAYGDARVMDAAIDEAISNLQNFAIVGTLEDIGGFENAMRQRYGARSSIGHLRQNPISRYPKFDEQPKELQEQIREMCQPDMAIYKSFSQRAAIERRDSKAPCAQFG